MTPAMRHARDHAALCEGIESCVPPVMATELRLAQERVSLPISVRWSEPLGVYRLLDRAHDTLCEAQTEAEARAAYRDLCAAFPAPSDASLARHSAGAS